MKLRHALLVLLGGCAAVGCNRGGTSSSQSSAPQGGLPVVMRGTDLSTYGIPGLIDVPAGCKITRLDESNVAIDREDDPFDLRILPLSVHVTTLADSRESMKDDPWQFVADEADGYAAWYYAAESRQHHIQVYREVTLGGRKFVAGAIIVDDRGSKALAESVWRTAKSVRAK